MDCSAWVLGPCLPSNIKYRRTGPATEKAREARCIIFQVAFSTRYAFEQQSVHTFLKRILPPIALIKMNVALFACSLT